MKLPCAQKYTDEMSVAICMLSFSLVCLRSFIRKWIVSHDICFHKYRTIADEYLSQKIAILHKMATLILFHCSWARITKVNSLNIFKFQLAKSKQLKLIRSIQGPIFLINIYHSWYGFFFSIAREWYILLIEILCCSSESSLVFVFFSID